MEGVLFSLKHKKSPIMILVVVLLLLALIGAGAFLLSRYTWAAGAFRGKNSESLDLRGEELTTQDYEELTRKLPNCDILWDVPFQGFRVSSDAQAVTVNQLSGRIALYKHGAVAVNRHIHNGAVIAAKTINVRNAVIVGILCQLLAQFLKVQP